ncbi:dihydroorotate dehydrogenase electron transfer subunit [Alloprevotella tannerae]|uniref:dihydroorotate dehydrogenase electron transfer subunit n=1 Tax=Alloprevotella tannerae TaxID=76122 RepID=UPI0028E5BCC4|nr:dihydroorotate dehydrogenase electron transfer subunit [Alloprevotella tannerae]
MKKYVSELRITAVEKLKDDYVLLKVTDEQIPFSDMMPGQFVNIRITNSPATFLRRPISINYVDESKNEMWLLVHSVGEGTRRLACLKAGDLLDCLFPLGNNFSRPLKNGRYLLIGGGVGTAPLLFLGKKLKEFGSEPVFLLGGKREEDLLQLDLFRKLGDTYTTTEDGSLGTKGFVTDHKVLEDTFEGIYTCGPKPMMKAVVKVAKSRNINCEVSLENLMACGLGACLCCVEKTVKGNVCVCTEGPVFNANQLTW